MKTLIPNSSPLISYSKLLFQLNIPATSSTCFTKVRATGDAGVPTSALSPPPPGFDCRTADEIVDGSREVTAKLHPELLDLVENGSLVVVEKKQFGPVPSRRAAFVEPEVVWLVGTSHASQASAVAVDRVVRAVRPERVVVELCRSRAGIMYINKEENVPFLKSAMFSLSGNKLFEAVNRSINLGGQAALALRLLLAFFSSKISSDANQPFGDEFRAARKVAEEIGAQIVLGDRPIEITLERAWKSLTWNEKINLIISLVRGVTSPTLLDLSKEQEKDESSSLQLYEQMGFSYPSLLNPLIHERDTYLAWSLKRSKAVNKMKRVVGVIGRGHMNGVVYALISDQGDLRFSDLAGKSPSKANNGWFGAFLKSLARDTLLGIVAWALFELLQTVLPSSDKIVHQ